MTLAPDDSSILAISNPIPFVDPVTIAVLPLMSWKKLSVVELTLFIIIKTSRWVTQSRIAFNVY